MNLPGEVGADVAGVRIEPADAEEAGWIRNARQKDEAAWERLMRRHQEPIFRLAYLLLGDGAEAEDVAQEAFIRAYLKLGQFDESRPFRPWLLSITANLARNRRRSLGRYWAALRRLFQAEPTPDGDRTGAAASAGAGIESQAEAQALWQAVQQLRPAAQEIIYLRYFLDLSEAETAETLGVAPGTVKSRLHRALRQLQTVIEQDFPDLRE